MQTPMQKVKPTVLILCTGNSCRSHLAEGILRAAAGDSLNVQSAGSKPAGYVHPLAIQVMKEIGIDISAHHSKHMNDFLQQPVETVITVCGNADQACPMFPGQVNRHHWGFDDPAHATGTDEEKLAVFRRVRDEIKMVFEAYAAGRRDQVKAMQPTKHNAKIMSQTLIQDKAQCRARTGARAVTRKIAVETSAGLLHAGRVVLRFGAAGCGQARPRTRLLGGRTPALPDGREHGSVLRQPRRARRAEARRSGARSGQRRRLRRVHRRPQGRGDRARHRRGHDAGDAGQGAAEHRALPRADRAGQRRVPARRNRASARGGRSVDAIISNCVINLSPDKPQVWREIARVLKPGGRVAVSDMALLKPLPAAVLKMVEALVGCVAGAVLVERDRTHGCARRA